MRGNPNAPAPKPRGPRGLGTVFFDKRRQRWIARVSLGNGRSKAFEALTQEEALAKRTDYARDVVLGRVDPTVKPSQLTLNEICQQWLEHHALTENLETTTTVVSYRSDLKRIDTGGLGCIRLSDLTEQHIINWLDTLLREGKRVSAHQSLLRLKAVLRWAKRRRLILTSPAAEIDPPKFERKKVNPPDYDALQVLFEQLRGNELEIPIRLMVAYGLRRQEVLGLRWSDIDLPRHQLHVRWRVNRVPGKGIITRTGVKMHRGDTAEWLHITPPIEALLDQQRQRCVDLHRRIGADWTGPGVHPTKGLSFVFPRSTPSNRPKRYPRVLGGPTAPDSFLKAFKKICLTIPGLEDATLHKLRHDHVGLSRQQGAPMDSIQRVVRHSSISITNDLYAHLPTGTSNSYLGPLHQWLFSAAPPSSEADTSE